MLGEFTTTTLPKCREVLARLGEIATNTGVDDIDLTLLETDAAEIAGLAFMNPKLPGVSAMIARKDAYDTVRAHTRLSKVFTRDRKDYYSKAANELQIEDKYLVHKNSLFLKYIEFSES